MKITSTVMKNEFCVFILTHGRPNDVKTVKALLNQGYTGNYYLVLDDEDSTIEEYKKNFGEDKIIVFSKERMKGTFDKGDTNKSNKVIIYARNIYFDLAQYLGYTYFLELDDDYYVFEFRKEVKDKFPHIKVRNLDNVFRIIVNYLENTNATTICIGQGGDYIGGKTCALYQRKVMRKAMNTFFCKVDRRFDFVGRINEDVNTYTSLGRVGKVLLTLSDMNIQQTQTQKTNGGMTGVYLDNGTYLKSFYSILYCPSGVKISCMGESHKRIHHRVKWNNCTVKILNERYKIKGD